MSQHIWDVTSFRTDGRILRLVRNKPVSKGEGNRGFIKKQLTKQYESFPKLSIVDPTGVERGADLMAECMACQEHRRSGHTTDIQIVRDIAPDAAQGRESGFVWWAEDGSVMAGRLFERMKDKAAKLADHDKVVLAIDARESLWPILLSGGAANARLNTLITDVRWRAVALVGTVGVRWFGHSGESHVPPALCACPLEPIAAPDAVRDA